MDCCIRFTAPASCSFSSTVGTGRPAHGWPSGCCRCSLSAGRKRLAARGNPLNARRQQAEGWRSRVVPPVMITNYFTLRALVDEWQDLVGSGLGDAFLLHRGAGSLTFYVVGSEVSIGVGITGTPLCVFRNGGWHRPPAMSC